MGFLFQSAALYDSLTVEQNVAFPLKRHTEMTKIDSGAIASSELLASVGMEGDLKKKPSDISGGMQKRVEETRASTGPQASASSCSMSSTRGARSDYVRRD